MLGEVRIWFPVPILLIPRVPVPSSRLPPNDAVASPLPKARFFYPAPQLLITGPRMVLLPLARPLMVASKAWWAEDPLNRPHHTYRGLKDGWEPDAKNSWVDVRSSESLYLMLWVMLGDSPRVNDRWESDELHLITSSYRPPLELGVWRNGKQRELAWDAGFLYRSGESDQSLAPIRAKWGAGKLYAEAGGAAFVCSVDASGKVDFSNGKPEIVRTAIGVGP